MTSHFRKNDDLIVMVCILLGVAGDASRSCEEEQGLGRLCWT